MSLNSTTGHKKEHLRPLGTQSYGLEFEVNIVNSFVDWKDPDKRGRQFTPIAIVTHHTPNTTPYFLFMKSWILHDDVLLKSGSIHTELYLKVGSRSINRGLGNYQFRF